MLGCATCIATTLNQENKHVILSLGSGLDRTAQVCLKDVWFSHWKKVLAFKKIAGCIFCDSDYLTFFSVFGQLQDLIFLSVLLRLVNGTLHWRIDPVKFFKSCLPHVVLGPFLNILPHIEQGRFLSMSLLSKLLLPYCLLMFNIS